MMGDEHEHDEVPDGCAVDMAADPMPDEDLDGVMLFADVDPNDAEAVEARAAEWREVFRDV
jgi:hypothetical protein